MANGIGTKYIDLTSLSQDEREQLDPYNTNQTGVLYNQAEPYFNKVAGENKDILDSFEIAAAMGDPDVSEDVQNIIKKYAPVSFYVNQAKPQSVDQQRIERVKNQLIEVLKTQIKNVEEYRVIYSNVFRSLNSMPAFWFNEFGNDAILAYGLFEKALNQFNEKEHEPTDGFTLYVRTCKGMIQILQDESFDSFISTPIDPIEDPNFDGVQSFEDEILYSPQAIFSEKKSDKKYWNLIQGLEDYLESASRALHNDSILPSSRSLQNTLSDLDSDLVSAIDDMLQALHECKNIQDDSYELFCEKQDQVVRMVAEHGVYFKIRPSYDVKTGEILGWSIQRGKIDYVEYYDLSQLDDTFLNSYEPLEYGNSDASVIPVYYLQSFFTKKDEQVLISASFDSESELIRSYTYGETVISKDFPRMIISKEDSQARFRQIKDKIEKSRSLDLIFHEVTQNFSDDELMNAMLYGTTGHELEHAWRHFNENDLSGYNSEESAFYSMALYSDDPVLYLFLAYLMHVHLDTFRLDSNAHSAALNDMLIGLAVQYQVEIDFVDSPVFFAKLFEAITTATENEEANQSLLRQNIAMAYQQRFGCPPAVLDQVHPVDIIYFDHSA